MSNEEEKFVVTRRRPEKHYARSPTSEFDSDSEDDEFTRFRNQKRGFYRIKRKVKLLPSNAAEAKPMLEQVWSNQSVLEEDSDGNASFMFDLFLMMQGYNITSEKKSELELMLRNFYLNEKKLKAIKDLEEENDKFIRKIKKRNEMVTELCEFLKSLK